MRFKGKLVVVTGASSGIGKATSEAFAREGAKVALVARRGEVLKETVSSIAGTGGTAMAVAADVTREED